MMDNVSISWEDFTESIPKIHRGLITDKDFTDVTLAANDNTQFKAHRVILSSCSKFFQNILTSNPHPSPLLYLNNVNQSELESLIEFIYLGRCEIKQNEVEKFVTLGHDFKINGLVQALTVMDEEDDLDALKEFLKKPMKEEPIIEVKQEETNIVSKVSNDNLLIDDQVDWWSMSNDSLQEMPDVPQVAIGKITIADDLQDTLRAKPFACDICDSKFAYSKTLRKHKRLSGHGAKLKCDVCNYNAKAREEMIIHWKHNHIGKDTTYNCIICEKAFPKYNALLKHKKYMHGMKAFVCDQCDYKAPKQGVLNKHITIVHEGKRVSCPICGAQFVSLANLKVHNQNIHEGVRYPCDQCDYSATQIQGLRGHQKIKHEGLRWECDQCDHKSTGKGNLQVHKETKHENKKYACDQCDFVANHPSSLNNHVKNKHEEPSTYNCGKCDKNYTGHDGPSKLQRHTDAIHNGVRFSCDKCDHKSMYSHGLAKHKQSKHVI